jgi:hypothetical protein
VSNVPRGDGDRGLGIRATAPGHDANDPRLRAAAGERGRGSARDLDPLDGGQWDLLERDRVVPRVVDARAVEEDRRCRVPR